MNIFVLDENPRIAAQMHCDKHISKMIIEHTQMLAAAYYHTLGISKKKEIAENQHIVDQLFKGWPRKHPDGSDHPYAISHVNHPCTIWTRESLDNFNWLIECTEELCQEFLNRWKNNPHSVKLIIDWMKLNPPKLVSKGITPFAAAMPICYQSSHAVISYKKYYAFKTTYMNVSWNKLNNQPEWWTPEFVSSSVSEYVPNPVPEKKIKVKKSA